MGNGGSTRGHGKAFRSRLFQYFEPPRTCERGNVVVALARTWLSLARDYLLTFQVGAFSSHAIGKHWIVTKYGRRHDAAAFFIFIVGIICTVSWYSDCTIRDCLSTLWPKFARFILRDGTLKYDVTMQACFSLYSQLFFYLFAASLYLCSVIIYLQFIYR